MIHNVAETVFGHAGWRDLRNNINLWIQFLKNFRRRLISRGKLKKASGNQLLINFGCGNLAKENWINIDMTDSQGVYFHDLRNLIPLNNQCAKHIHCEHFLEHLEYSYAKKLLRECYRLLENGATLRLIVPDAEKYLKAYCFDDKEFFEQLKNLGGSPKPYNTKMEIINQMFRMDDDHKFAWDFETLKLALSEAGFTQINRSEIGDIEAQYNIDGTDWWRPVESLYINATKSNT
ncbi:class I SAM-dependent methyltransferase [Methylomonas sp. YC3]